MNERSRALLVVAAEPAQVGGGARGSSPARTWVERTLSAVALAHGSSADHRDGALFPSSGAAVRCALDVAAASSGSPWRAAMAVHSGHGELRRRASSLLAAAHGGQVVLTAEAAQPAFDDLPSRATLRPLGAHRLADLSPPHEVYQLCHEDLASTFPALRSLDALSHNLPVQPTTFVGHADTIDEIVSILARQPLVTLTGPGGVGKTRIALQASASIAHHYPAGVVFVELAHLHDPALVADHVADAVGTPQESSIEAWLENRCALIVLDNCEHLLAACAEISSNVTRACPGVQLIVTSREPLRVSGEAVVHVRVLRISPDAVDQEAVRMFAERAVLVAPGFALSDENEGAVTEICRRLDGLPLAIELAAARVRQLSPRQIADRLEDRFRLLRSGPRDAPPRQQTLGGLVDWSYELLSDTERALFARLSAFAGGFDLDAACAVCAGEGLESEDVLEALDRLVDCSLVTASTSGPAARYGMLETLREYASGKRVSGDEVRARHLSWLLELAARAFRGFWGPDRAEWFARLELERGNIETALRWALDSGRAAEAVDLAGSVGHFWYVRGHLREGRAWLEEALAGRDAARPCSAALALAGAGALALIQGDLGSARNHFVDAVRIARLDDDPLGVADALSNLALVERDLGHLDEARALIEESLAIVRPSGDDWTLSRALGNFGHQALEEGDAERARSLYEEGLQLARKVGDRYTVASLLPGLAAATGGPDARPLLEEACVLLREVDDRPNLALTLCDLADLAHGRGDATALGQLAGEALAIARELELTSIEARCSELLQGVAPKPPQLPQGRTFRREGASWTISDGTEALRLKDAKGLRYLSVLLGRPGVEVHSLDLVGAVRPDPASRRALDEFREEMREAETSGNAERAARAQAGIDAFSDRLTADVRRAAPAAEKARQNVTRAIKAVVKRIAKYSPSLAHHLSVSVRTGLYCCYLPGPHEDATWAL